MNNNVALLDTTLPIQSIDAYITRAHQIPMLSEGEEFELARKLHQEHDLSAAKKLILPHLRYVIKIARGFLGYGLPLADLIQEGNVGLMKAVKRFNPELKIRLVTFALHWIKAEIHEYVIKNWRIVKIATTKAQRKLFFKLRGTKKYLMWFTQDEVNTVAKDLGVKPEEVRHMEMRLNAEEYAFDSDDEDDEFAPAHYLEDHNLSPTTMLEHKHQVQDNQALLMALEKLSDRDRDIVESRWLHEHKATLHDLAAKYQVSAERIRQLEKIAFDKIKTMLLPNAQG